MYKTDVTKLQSATCDVLLCKRKSCDHFRRYDIAKSGISHKFTTERKAIEILNTKFLEPTSRNNEKSTK